MIKSEIKPPKEPSSPFSDSFRIAMKNSRLFIGFSSKYEMTKPEDIAHLINKKPGKKKVKSFMLSPFFYFMPILAIIALILYLF